jgi:hypothetical protein
MEQRGNFIFLINREKKTKLFLVNKVVKRLSLFLEAEAAKRSEYAKAILCAMTL